MRIGAAAVERIVLTCSIKIGFSRAQHRESGTTRIASRPVEKLNTAPCTSWWAGTGPKVGHSRLRFFAESAETYTGARLAQSSASSSGVNIQPVHFREPHSRQMKGRARISRMLPG